MIPYKKLHELIIASLLIFALFSFSTTLTFNESADICCETALDDNSDTEPEDEVEKKLFVLSQNISYTLNVTLHNIYLPQKLTQGLLEQSTHFRPPIFS